MPIPDDAELFEVIASLLAEPEQQDNPLRAPLARLLEHNERQRERLERLLKISDGYHGVSRRTNLTLAEQYDQQLRRLEKLARISDRYQNSLRELSQALKEASLRDPLTGLGNRRFLMERLHEETERANRKSGAYALAILDVDHFKTINDRFGHEAGDKALSEIAKAIEAALRDYDLCGRWGGEEFLVVMPETGLDAANQVAERVRQGVHAVTLDYVSCPVSVSLGLTTYRPGEDFSETLNRADAALLQAKANGRNRVEIG